MKEYRALHDTWVRGRPFTAGKTMMIEPDLAKGYVDGGLLRAVEDEAAEEAKNAKAKGEATAPAKAEKDAKAS